MSVDEVDGRVRTVFADVLGLEENEVGPETSAETVEEWTSLQHMTLILALEDEFEIQFDDQETVTAVTFPSIVEVVRHHVEMVEPR